MSLGIVGEENGPELCLVLGGVASGKTTYTIEAKPGAIIDYDEIKVLLQSYQKIVDDFPGDELKGHTLAFELLNLPMRAVVEQARNGLIDKKASFTFTSAFSGGLEPMLEQVREAGYTINVDVVLTSVAQAFENFKPRQNRYFVPPEWVHERLQRGFVADDFHPQNKSMLAQMCEFVTPHQGKVKFIWNDPDTKKFSPFAILIEIVKDKIPNVMLVGSDPRLEERVDILLNDLGLQRTPYSSSPPKWILPALINGRLLAVTEPKPKSGAVDESFTHN